MVDPQPNFIKNRDITLKCNTRGDNNMIVPVVYRDVMPDLYYVSDKAKIYMKTSSGYLDISDRLKVASNGYWYIRLMSKSGNNKPYPIYRIVLASFLGDQPDKVVDYIDMNKNHNELSNLEFVTYDENLRRAAAKNGIIYRELIDEATVRKICEMAEKGYNMRKIQRKLGLDQTAANDDLIMRIIHRKTWKHITKDYTWDIDNIRLKVYKKEDLRVIADLVMHSAYTPKEIAKMFPQYGYKQLHQVVKKMRQGKLYKKFLNEAGSTTILGQNRDSEGFMYLIPTKLGVERLRKIRADDGADHSRGKI